MNLFIDTTANYILFCLFNDNLIIKNTKVITTHRNQAEKFIIELDDFLNINNISISDITSLYVTNGPGSFTGVRVALTFAKALKVSKYTKVYTLSSLDLLCDNHKDCVAIIDARGGKYYYLSVNDNIFSDYEIVDKEKVANKCYNTYDNQIDNIFLNLMLVISANRFVENIDALYIKGYK